MEIRKGWQGHRHRVVVLTTPSRRGGRTTRPTKTICSRNRAAPRERAERDALAAAQELADQEAAAVKAQELGLPPRRASPMPIWNARASSRTDCATGALKSKDRPKHRRGDGRQPAGAADADHGSQPQNLDAPAFSAKPDGRKSRCSERTQVRQLFVIGSKPLLHDGRPVSSWSKAMPQVRACMSPRAMVVVLCIDAGNLLSVARQFRERDADAIIVVGADNDIWGQIARRLAVQPWHGAAQKVALLGALVAAPPFCENDATGMDCKGNLTGERIGTTGTASKASVLWPRLSTYRSMVNCRRRGSQTRHLQFIRLIVLCWSSRSRSKL